MTILGAIINNSSVAKLWATTGCWTIFTFAVSVKNWIQSDISWSWCSRIVVGSTRITITSGIVIRASWIVIRASWIVVRATGIVIRATGIVIRASVVVAMPCPGQS